MRPRLPSFPDLQSPAAGGQGCRSAATKSPRERVRARLVQPGTPERSNEIPERKGQRPPRPARNAGAQQRNPGEKGSAPASSSQGCRSAAPKSRRERVRSRLIQPGTPEHLSQRRSAAEARSSQCPTLIFATIARTSISHLTDNQ